MCFVLYVGTAADFADEIIIAAPVHADDKHIHIIMAVRTGKRLFFDLRQGDFFN